MELLDGNSALKWIKSNVKTIFTTMHFFGIWGLAKHLFTICAYRSTCCTYWLIEGADCSYLQIFAYVLHHLWVIQSIFKWQLHYIVLLIIFHTLSILTYCFNNNSIFVTYCIQPMSKNNYSSLMTAY